ncbi:MAG: NAD(P)H-dependent oxidoreductase subunit E [Candidatus Wallbacteria bacterium HGW-Wallbacteria-1]|uniref:NAD(P)H-dependent oxidoreductase subunit E n=1 Tax=Candidatus Wallbacteria bacterium HGW-Wallbacteria-1 TaxID=2013854 RepID=A0A2N1PRE8_9BACT|nr:MAG: NAD(P)H-dependent oxidoreductase subunit E [Candidatus Wallbacteria bacterium HGW-Wallbacteria-1]
MCCSSECPLAPAVKPTETLSEITEILNKYPRNMRELLIPILQDTQGRFGYLSRQAMTEVARHVGVAASKVFGVVTFYNQFKLTPPGRVEILVCRGTACHVKGSDQLLKALEGELGIKAGTTTRDGEFGLDVVACLGSCSLAPVITVNGTFHGRVTANDVGKLLTTLKEGNA